MHSIKEMITSLYPSLAEVYTQDYMDDKEKMKALLVKAYERLESVRIQLNKRVEIDWGDSTAGYCMKYFDYLRCIAEDEVYNLVAIDYNNILDVINNAKESQNANRKERRQRVKNIKSLEYDLILLDIVDNKRKTPIEVDMLFEGTDPITYKGLKEQISSFEEIVGVIALCIDERNHALKQKMWAKEQELRLNEWRHRELAEEHKYAVTDSMMIEAYRDYDATISSLATEVKVGNLNNMIRLLKITFDGELLNKTPSLISELVVDKRELIMTLMMI